RQPRGSRGKGEARTRARSFRLSGRVPYEPTADLEHLGLRFARAKIFIHRGLQPHALALSELREASHGFEPRLIRFEREAGSEPRDLILHRELRPRSQKVTDRGRAHLKHRIAREF